MADEIKQLLVGISREGEVIVEQGINGSTPWKLSEGLEFGCEVYLFRDPEREIYAVMDSNVQPW